MLLVAGTALAVNKICPDTCGGTGGEDRLVGSPRANTIDAGDGNGRVLGRGGEDALKGGDVLDRGEGTDTAYFVEGQDTVIDCEITGPPPG